MKTATSISISTRTLQAARALAVKQKRTLSGLIELSLEKDIQADRGPAAHAPKKKPSKKKEAA